LYVKGKGEMEAWQIYSENSNRVEVTLVLIKV